MSYSARIMNLPHSSGLVSQRPAAEIAGEADATRDELVALLVRSEEALGWYAEYLNEAPVWHCTGFEANRINPLLADVRAALARAKGQA